MSKKKYLRRIYTATDAGEESTTTSELAEIAQVTDASASEAVSKLEEKDLVCKAPYQGFTLSPMGKEEGKKLKQKHDILESFFEKIGLEKPDKEAENVETSISEQAVTQIKEEILDN